MKWIPATTPPPEYRTLIIWVSKPKYLGLEPYCSTGAFIQGKWKECIRSHSSDPEEIDDWTIDEEEITVSHYIVPEPPTLALTVGKKYLCRDGLTTRTIINYANSLYWSEKDDAYDYDGTLHHQLYPEPKHHPLDLIKEL